MGSETLEKLCFTNGKNYTQAVDPAHAVEVMGDGNTRESYHIYEIFYLLIKGLMRTR